MATTEIVDKYPMIKTLEDAYLRLDEKEKNMEFWRQRNWAKMEEIRTLYGKIAILKNENNKLRKKLYPGK